MGVVGAAARAAAAAAFVIGEELLLQEEGRRFREQHHVLRLQVPMHHAYPVSGSQVGSQRSHHQRRLPLAVVLLRDDGVEELPSGAEARDEKDTVSRGARGPPPLPLLLCLLLSPLLLDGVQQLDGVGRALEQYERGELDQGRLPSRRGGREEVEEEELASGILLAATTAPLALCTHRATVAAPPEPRELRGSYSSSKERERDLRSMESAALKKAVLRVEGREGKVSETERLDATMSFFALELLPFLSPTSLSPSSWPFVQLCSLSRSQCCSTRKGPSFRWYQ